MDFHQLLNEDIQVLTRNVNFCTSIVKESEAQFCSQCFKVISTETQMTGFVHSCPKSGTYSALPVTSVMFYEHCCSVVESMSPQNSKLVNYIIQTGKANVENSNQVILLLLGDSTFAQSKTFRAAIMMFYAIYDSKTFCALHPTRTDASQLNKSTLLCFLGVKFWSDNEQEDGKIHAQTGLSCSQLATIRLVRTIFLEDFGLLSGHQFNFLNCFLKAVHNNDEFFGGVNVIFCEHYFQCKLLLASSLIASSDCMLFNLTKEHNFASILAQMDEYATTTDLIDHTRNNYGTKAVGNKRVGFFVDAQHCH
jgi:hypothetical protein